MAILGNSYGSLSGVGARTPLFSDPNGTFTSSTTPREATVENWINEVSAMLNMMLRQAGFSVPINQADVLLVVQMFVEQEVADLVKEINSTGRLAIEDKEKPTPNLYKILLTDVRNFVSDLAVSFDRFGATRTETELVDFEYLDEDADGNDISPLFTATDFGNPSEL